MLRREAGSADGAMCQEFAAVVLDQVSSSLPSPGVLVAGDKPVSFGEEIEQVDPRW